MWHPRLVSLLTCGTALLLFVAGTAISASDRQPDENGAVPAIWKIQNVSFEFRGDTVSYTCESFKRKLRNILMEVGVHASLIIQAQCAPAVQQPFLRAPDPGGAGREAEPLVASRALHMTRLSSRISTQIALAVPAIANERNIQYATTFDAQRQLVAKVNDEDLPTASNIQMFPAVWAPISLSDGVDTWLVASDCELLKQLSSQVFPKLGIEVTHSRLVCSASVTSKPLVEVRALLPMIARKSTQD
jgi:hypothetical protein